jgi:hypothetical protein
MRAAACCYAPPDHLPAGVDAGGISATLSGCFVSLRGVNRLEGVTACMGRQRAISIIELLSPFKSGLIPDTAWRFPVMNMGENGTSICVGFISPVTLVDDQTAKFPPIDLTRLP